MNPDRRGSDLVRLNSAVPGTRVPIHSSTWEVLRLAQRFHALTDGVFDPSLPVRPGRLCDLEVGPAAGADRTLTPAAADGGADAWAICHAPLTLDLGGIAKGYAVDQAVQALIAAGCGAGLVNAGGDLRVFGSHPAPLLLRHSDGSYEPIELANEALAVTDGEIARAPSGHRGYYSRTTDAVTARREVAVVAGDAVTADALTKCALLCPPEQTARLLRACGARLLV
jgi:FAD:protein FMN transferase